MSHQTKHNTQLIKNFISHAIQSYTFTSSSAIYEVKTDPCVQNLGVGVGVPGPGTEGRLTQFCQTRKNKQQNLRYYDVRYFGYIQHRT